MIQDKLYSKQLMPDSLVSARL